MDSASRRPLASLLAAGLLAACDRSPAGPVTSSPGLSASPLAAVAPSASAAASGAPAASAHPSGSSLPSADTRAAESACATRIEAALSTPARPGAPAFDQDRPAFLGRARSEPMVFIDEPAAIAESEVDRALLPSWKELRQGPPGGRVARVIARHRRDRVALRTLLLRQGYVYAPDPHDALALTTGLHLADLFDEPEIWQSRGADVWKLERRVTRFERSYVHADGPRRGLTADLIFGDRVALQADGLNDPWHRDLRALADVEGFDRTRIVHRSPAALVVELRYGEAWSRALLASDGARLSVACRASATGEVAAFQARTAARRQALSRQSGMVTAQVDEALRFDRPEGEKTAERDGQLRPRWFDAYRRGAQAFEAEGHSYPVFDPSGRPWPPQVCVDFVLDTYERAGGTWFTARGEAPTRRVGTVDLDAEGIRNRRGVLAFETFASSRPDRFAVRRFSGNERIPFERRADFFAFLLAHADEFQPGDTLAIHGRKRDGLIHQHAILLERTDPVSGFPYGLADQMKRPRRRTWEGIMAEAPLRSLLYRVHPADALFGL